MIKIKVDMELLAKKVVDKFDFHIVEDHVGLDIKFQKAFEELIYDYISKVTPPQYLITELEYKTLIEELDIFVYMELFHRIKTIIHLADDEDGENYANSIKIYEVERE